MNDNHINLQPIKTSKIFGVLKMGANNTDQKVIRTMQLQGYDEFEIQSRAGVHYLTVRSFMLLFNPNFVETPVPATPETQHLHDRIAELEKEKAEQEAPKQAALETQLPQTVELTATEIKERMTQTAKKSKLRPKVKPKAKVHTKIEKPQAASAVTANDY